MKKINNEELHNYFIELKAMIPNTVWGFHKRHKWNRRGAP